jgi:hypothetical protein
MSKLGLVGTRDDADVVNPSTSNIIVDLGEVIARISQLLTVNRSGNLLDVVKFDWGLGQVSPFVLGADDDVALVNEPLANDSLSCRLTTSAIPGHYSGFYRYLSSVETDGLGIEWWFAVVYNPQDIYLITDVYDGSEMYVYKMRYKYSTKILSIYTAPSGVWYDVATINLPTSYEVFNKVKMIVDLKNHCYNRIVFNGVTYTVNTQYAQHVTSTLAPFIEVITRLENQSASISQIAVGKVVVTQNEELAVC